MPAGMLEDDEPDGVVGAEDEPDGVLMPALPEIVVDDEVPLGVVPAAVLLVSVPVGDVVLPGDV